MRRFTGQSFLVVAAALLMGLTGLSRGMPAAAVSGPVGTLFLCGGKVADSDSAIWSAFRRYASLNSHEPRPRVAVFCSARRSLAAASNAFSEDSAEGWSYRRVFQSYGMDPVFVPVAIDRYATAAFDPANVRLVASADAAWFGGGNQMFHARCLLRDDGSDTPVMRAVRDLYRRGGVVGGTSAGAAVTDAFTYAGGDSYDYLVENTLRFRPLSSIHAIARPTMGPAPVGTYSHGFGFVRDIDAAVDTHANARGRYGRILTAMHFLRNRYGIALAEDTAIAIRGTKGQVFGSNRVFVADSSHARYAPGAPFGATGIVANSLTQDDGFDFSTGRVLTRKPLITGPSRARAYESNRVLDADELLKAMEGLVDSPDADVTGRSRESAPTRFVVTLRRGTTTRGFRDPTTGRYAVQGVDLDVVPGAD